jgi:hypothetical protein
VTLHLGSHVRSHSLVRMRWSVETAVAVFSPHCHLSPHSLYSLPLHHHRRMDISVLLLTARPLALTRMDRQQWTPPSWRCYAKCTRYLDLSMTRSWAVEWDNDKESVKPWEASEPFRSCIVNMNQYVLEKQAWKLCCLYEWVTTGCPDFQKAEHITHGDRSDNDCLVVWQRLKADRLRSEAHLSTVHTPR